FYQDNFGGGNIPKFIKREIKTWVAKLGKEHVIEAMKETLSHTKPNWKYVTTILQS
ncbi:DnaD domain protein, partial [Aquibacillus sediminis]|uniref:DnaD domain protein n=1 Tax=Aquibacillus sediminis TaxID=2574734 RepID=UPI001109B756